MSPFAASWRAARAPNPLDAPVTTMTFRMTESFSDRKDLNGGCRVRLGEPAVGAQNLSVHPGAVLPYEERHRIRDILGLAQAFARREPGELIELAFRLVIEKRRGGNRTWRQTIHGDVPVAEFVGKHMDETFDARL